MNKSLLALVLVCGFVFAAETPAPAEGENAAPVEQKVPEAE